MARAFDQPETTWTVEPDRAELYTTSRRIWLRAIARNPNVLEAVALEPGYRAVWEVRQLRTPEMLLRPAPGGDLALVSYLTPEEQAVRAAAGERLRAATTRATVDESTKQPVHS